MRYGGLTIARISDFSRKPSGGAGSTMWSPTKIALTRSDCGAVNIIQPAGWVEPLRNPSGNIRTEIRQTEAAYIATLQARPIITTTSQINKMRNSRISRLIRRGWRNGSAVSIDLKIRLGPTEATTDCIQRHSPSMLRQSLAHLPAVMDSVMMVVLVVLKTSCPGRNAGKGS